MPHKQTLLLILILSLISTIFTQTETEPICTSEYELTNDNYLEFLDCEAAFLRAIWLDQFYSEQEILNYTFGGDNFETIVIDGVKGVTGIYFDEITRVNGDIVIRDVRGLDFSFNKLTSAGDIDINIGFVDDGMGFRDLFPSLTTVNSISIQGQSFFFENSFNSIESAGGLYINTFANAISNSFNSLVQIPYGRVGIEIEGNDILQIVNSFQELNHSAVVNLHDCRLNDLKGVFPKLVKIGSLYVSNLYRLTSLVGSFESLLEVREIVIDTSLSLSNSTHSAFPNLVKFEKFFINRCNDGELVNFLPEVTEGGRFEIDSETTITGIRDSFNKLNSLEDIRIESPLIQKIENCFNGITNLTGGLIIRDALSLYKIDNSFKRLNSVSYLAILDSNVVEVNLPELLNVNILLRIAGNSLLTKISLPKAVQFGGYASISANTNLYILELENLEEISGYFSVSGSSLTNLRFTNLTKVGGDMFILGNRELRQIEVPHLQTIGGEIFINGNKGLNSLEFLSNVSYGNMTSVGNSILCDTAVGIDNIVCCGDGIIQEEENNEFCDGDLNCNSDCTECSETYYGNNCEKKCDCVNGFCDYGISGTGRCISCDEDFFGLNCSQNCTCQNGQCRSGINGDGHCQKCFTKYYGEDCQNYCFCGEGTCDSRTGICNICAPGYYGTNCHIPARTDRPISPILNCAKLNEDGSYTSYLGYSKQVNDEYIMDSIFSCSTGMTKTLTEVNLVTGQNNFIWKVDQCDGDISWTLNGMELYVPLPEIRKLVCNRTNQQFIFSTGNELDSSQIDSLRFTYTI